MLEDTEPSYTPEEAAVKACVPLSTMEKAIRCARIAFTVHLTAPDQGYVRIPDHALQEYLIQRPHQYTSHEEMQDPAQGGDYLNLAQASRLFQINYWTLYKHVQQGLLPSLSVQLPSFQHRLITQSAMVDYMKIYHEPVPDEYVSVGTAATLLRVSPQRVRQLCTKREGLTMRWINGYRYIAMPSVLERAQRQRQARREGGNVPTP